MNSDATDRHSATHTPGPWRWELNKQTKHLSLVGGKPLYDLTIIQPTRWGMGSATLLMSAVQRSVCDGSGPAQEVAAKAIRKATE